MVNADPAQTLEREAPTPLLEWRRCRALSQAQVAELVGVSEHRWSEIEGRGPRSRPSLATALRISTVTGIDARALWPDLAFVGTFE